MQFTEKTRKLWNLYKNLLNEGIIDLNEVPMEKKQH